MSRTAESIINEAYYWKTINDDLRPLHDLILEAADALVDVPVAILESVVAPAGREESLQRATTGASVALSKLKEIQTGLSQIGELIGGRLTAIQVEMHGAEHESDE